MDQESGSNEHMKKKILDLDLIEKDGDLRDSCLCCLEEDQLAQLCESV